MDSSVLLLLLDGDAAKADLAERIVREGVIVTAQVMAETIQVLQSVLGMRWDEIDECVESIRMYASTHSVTNTTLDAARTIARQSGLDFAAALLVAAAAEAGCATLYSARLHDVAIANVSVNNPFVAARASAAPAQAKQKSPRERLALLYARPGFLLRRAHQISAAIFEGACCGVGITPGQLSVLTVLNACPRLDQATLSRAIGLDKVTTSHLVRALEARGLLTRSPADSRRGVSMELTAEGNVLLDRVEPCLDSAYEMLMSVLNATEQAQLVTVLNRLNERLEDRARTPFRPL
ncbi:Predicted nucleic acid-binding protein, contains PIN domain [Paraburkholderia lycopersici]|uniref:Predicted nucleic acid-binding protein, contains PIN domain n=1 Tax=Paraburkholderia lycopersici TaxID=416944 RepID=A0A1G7BH49_9BURK|nr:Predicted nucleic acid-binding protein, contains PIN domain [Paraburkholderia lycopersici]